MSDELGGLQAPGAGGVPGSSLIAVRGGNQWPYSN